MRTTLPSMVALAVLSLPAAAADLESLERQLEQARAEAPMVMKPFMTVKRPAKYFGDYEPRKSNAFSHGEKVLFYGEPKNITFGKKGDAMELAFDVDVEVKGPDGKTIGQEKMVSFKMPTRSRVQDVYLNLDLSLDKAPPGDYNVKFIVRDGNSKKRAEVSEVITIQK